MMNSTLDVPENPWWKIQAILDEENLPYVPELCEFLRRVAEERKNVY